MILLDTSPTWVSSTSCCSWTSSSRSHSSMYLTMIAAVRVPWICETQAWFWRVACTVRCRLRLCGMAANNDGARSTMHCPCNHLSVQNIVSRPFPTSKFIAIAKKARTWSRSCTSRLTQGWWGYVFFNQSQWDLNTHPRILRLEMPRPPPPIHRPTHNVLCNKTVSPSCFLVPSPKVTLLDFVNWLVCLLRKIQCHGQIYDGCC
jgi:hypothetical protein